MMIGNEEKPFGSLLANRVPKPKEGCYANWLLVVPDKMELRANNDKVII